jgi:hypothetical protein
MTIDIRYFEDGTRDRDLYDPFYAEDSEGAGFYNVGIKHFYEDEPLARNKSFLLDALPESIKENPKDPNSVLLKLRTGSSMHADFETNREWLFGKEYIEGNLFYARIRNQYYEHGDLQTGLSITPAQFYVKEDIYKEFPALNLKILVPEFYNASTKKVPILFSDMDERRQLEILAPTKCPVSSYCYEIQDKMDPELLEFIQSVTGVPQPRFVSVKAPFQSMYQSREILASDRRFPEFPIKDVEFEIGL